MSTFPGLCIGGPLDGELREMSSPSFEVAVSSLTNRVAFRYRHMSTEEGIHFWLFDGETPATVLTKLATGYIKLRSLGL